nr:hypothetical protein [Sedimentibacter sp.]
MRKIISLVLVVLLVIGSFTLVYGFSVVNMENELESIVDTEIPYYDNILTDLFNQYDDLNVSYDIISGTIVSYNPFTVYLDSLKGVTGGFGPAGGFPISTEYAQISIPDYNCVKDGYYEAPHPYNSTYYSETYSKNVRTYGESSEDVKKAYELEKSIRYTAKEYSKAQM